jgi:hypothetical protein
MDFRRRVAIVAFALTLVAGCRHNHAAHELIERELRWQEDRIYELEAKLEDAQRELDAFRGVTYPREVVTRETVSDGVPIRSRIVEESSPRSSAPIDASRTTPPSRDNGGTVPQVELPAPSRVVPGPPPAVAPTIIAPPTVDVPEGLPSKRPAVTPPPAVEVPPPPAANEPKTPAPPAGTREPPTIPPPTTVPPPFKTMSSPKFVPPSARPKVLDPEAMAPPPSFTVPPVVTFPEPRVAANAAAPSPGKLPAAESGAPLPAAPPPVEIAAPPAIVSSRPIGAPVETTQDEAKKLVITARTTGVNLDGRPGDDGLLVVVEAHDARDRITSNVGAVSIALIDSALPSDSARFARWDFDAGDAAALFRPAVESDGAGLYFEVAWPETPPVHSRLRLFVRMTLPDGRTLQTDREVTVRLASTTSQNAPAPFPSDGEVIPASQSVRSDGGPPSAADRDLNWGVPRRAGSAAEFTGPAMLPNLARRNAPMAPPPQRFTEPAAAEPVTIGPALLPPQP